ncbi:MAG TPA: NUDIX hydrolase [Anaerolineales bacterium]|nr:NUDIX hydrolase [Anaerolineales bacterium]HRQ91640.1 NUDIX hydrolase [Anaerolineales bacterium]
MATYKTISSELAYRGQKFSVRRDILETSDGREAIYDTVVHIGAVSMVPVDADGKILLVRQYRHSTGKQLLELPAGTLEPGEAAEVTAQRELREEIGMGAGVLTLLAEFYLAPGYSTERMWIYLAQELVPDALPPDQDEDLEVVRLSLEECLAAIGSGEIEDAKTMLGLYMAQRALATE